MWPVNIEHSIVVYFFIWIMLVHNKLVQLLSTQKSFLNCDICMCVVNKQCELLEFVFDSTYVDLQNDEISLTFTAGCVSLCCVCSHVVVFVLSVRLSWYHMWMRWLMWLWCVYCCLCCMCVCWGVWGCEVNDNAGVGNG